jgi:N6-adenosine-specific RNA methylase IME4
MIWDELVARGPYKAIVADPPWSYNVWSKTGAIRSASQHYTTMSLEDIKALPVADLAAPDCCLFLWATDPLLVEAFEVINSWGFKFKTVGFYWAKLNKKSDDFFTGLGFWTRANPEQCLLATKGKPQRINKGIRKLVIARRGAHSQKPEEVQNRIEKLVPGPYCELFARRSRDGWAVWGDEI